jgi:F-box/leucine-rich repeat protein 2/20
MMESCGLVTERSLTMLGEGCPFLQELDLTDCRINNTGLKSISRCSELITLNLGFCLNISAEGIIHIGACCSNLQELNLYRSVGTGDAGLEAIANGCPRLKSINISYCINVTDNSMKSISRLQKLHNLEIRGCPGISSAGLSAIALGCKRIVALDVKGCYNIDDAGILAIADSCQNLRQINVSYCPISDVGLSTLARLSCLQNMKLVHLKNVTVNGFASALLDCESLKKLKLFEGLKFILPRSLIECLEARGCSIRWMDKPFVI